MANDGISFRGEDSHPWLSCSCLTGLWGGGGQRATGVRNTTT